MESPGSSSFIIPHSRTLSWSLTPRPHRGDLSLHHRGPEFYSGPTPESNSERPLSGNGDIDDEEGESTTLPALFTTNHWRL